MEKVLYYKVPRGLKKLHHGIKGMKLFKGIWGNFELTTYLEDFKPRLVILDEVNLEKYNKELSILPRSIKLVVISNDLNVLERADGILTDDYELITKLSKFNLQDKPQQLYLWALEKQILTRCLKCSEARAGTHYECAVCGSELVEVAQAENLV